jgi:hypothetical protein
MFWTKSYGGLYTVCPLISAIWSLKSRQGKLFGDDFFFPNPGIRTLWGLPLLILPASIKLIVPGGRRGREMFCKHVSTWVRDLWNRSRGGSQTDSHLRIPRTGHLWRSGCPLVGCDTLQAYEEQGQMTMKKRWIAPHERHDNSVVLLPIRNICMENKEFLGSCGAFLDKWSSSSSNRSGSPLLSEDSPVRQRPFTRKWK